MSLPLPQVIIQITGNCPICCKPLPNVYRAESGGWIHIDCLCRTEITFNSSYPNSNLIRTKYSFKVRGKKHYLSYSLYADSSGKHFYLRQWKDNVIELHRDGVPSWSNLIELKEICKRYINLQVFS